tara:strand:+ start:5035 stop:5205 length:171 start_codon:yes stop_codon:yes gene_type:complete
MKNLCPKKNALLKKLKKIGDLSLINCSHKDDDISDNSRNINRLARDCFEALSKSVN